MAILLDGEVCATWLDLIAGDASHGVSKLFPSCEGLHTKKREVQAVQKKPFQQVASCITVAETNCEQSLSL